MVPVFAAVLSLSFFLGISSAEETPNFKNELEKTNYSIGYQVGSDFHRQSQDIDPELLIKGIQDALSGAEPLLSSEEMRTSLTNLQKRIMAAQQEEQKRTNLEKAELNREISLEFLTNNKNEEGVISLESGLQYKVLENGGGANPSLNDTVVVHYRGTLVDGTEFDSSFKRKKPASFMVNELIEGWQEALLMMQEGAKWQIFVPPQLAYGDKRTGIIEPNSMLIFELELISIQ